MNFAGARLRVYGGSSSGDVIIAERPIKPGQWTHCAITRDPQNRFRIYLDGEPDTAIGKLFGEDFTRLNLAESSRGRNTTADFDEVRIWNIARSPEEIRRDFHTRLTSDVHPTGLVLRACGGDPGGVSEGSAITALTMDFPKLVSPAEASSQETKFGRFRALAALPGDAAKGKILVQTNCMICHQIKGEGALIGPNLSGAGAMGVESLLRNILTPNAQLESGYYRHDLKLKDGLVFSGFVSSENDASITLRRIGSDEIVIPRSDIVDHEISRLSLMPEGLIENFSDTQVADLFSYLNSLR